MLLLTFLPPPPVIVVLLDASERASETRVAIDASGGARGTKLAVAVGLAAALKVDAEDGVATSVAFTNCVPSVEVEMGVLEEDAVDEGTALAVEMGERRSASVGTGATRAALLVAVLVAERVTVATDVSETPKGTGRGVASAEEVGGDVGGAVRVAVPLAPRDLEAVRESVEVEELLRERGALDDGMVERVGIPLMVATAD